MSCPGVPACATNSMALSMTQQPCGFKLLPGQALASAATAHEVSGVLRHACLSSVVVAVHCLGLTSGCMCRVRSRRCARP